MYASSADAGGLSLLEKIIDFETQPYFFSVLRYEDPHTHGTLIMMNAMGYRETLMRVNHEECPTVSCEVGA